jgi:oligopeptide transport system ATP-binding protein
MYLGRIVEIADRDDLYRAPLPPYTEALIAAVPVAGPEVEARRRRAVISGEVPSALRPPPGRGFHTRCPRAIAICKTEEPLLRGIGTDRAVACHLHVG